MKPLRKIASLAITAVGAAVAAAVPAAPAAGSALVTGPGPVKFGCTTRPPVALTAPTQITLVTGDVVAVERGYDGCWQVSVQPATPEVSFLIVGDASGRIYVYPDLVTSLLDKAVSRDLFEITNLIDDGYDDPNSSWTGLIIQYADLATAQAVYAGTAGVFGDALDRKTLLSIVNAVAGQQPKTPEGAAEFRATLWALRAAQAAGVPHPIEMIELNDRIRIPDCRTGPC